MEGSSGDGLAGERGGAALGTRFDVVVLAGGRGTRLGGEDKPGLRVGGRTLAESVVQAARDAGARRVVVVGPERAELSGGSRVVAAREEPAGAGPVAALRAGMRHVQAPLVVVLAADLPFLRGRHLRWLAGAPAPPGAGAGAVMVDDREREQWLLSVWRTDVLRDALTGYSGQSLHGVLGGLGPVRVRYPVAAGEVGPWVDCDTPEELAWVRRWHEEAEQRRRRGERA